MPSPRVDTPTDRGLRQPEDGLIADSEAAPAEASKPGQLTTGRRIALGLAAGVAIAMSLPPWGWWPLAFAGTALLSFATASSSARARFGVGLAAGAAWMLIGMAWMWFLTPPGYLIAALLFASFHGLAAAATPHTPNRLWIGPIMHTLAEVVRMSFPFGGVPLATLAISASASPLLPAARLGGAVLLTWMVLQSGFALVALRTRPRPAGVTLASVAVVLIVAMVAPAGNDDGRLVDVAAVQGGGEQGTTALEVPAAEVFAVHLDATRTIQATTATDSGSDAPDQPPPSLGLVTWPENGVGMPNGTEFVGSAWHDELAAEAARLGVPILVGLTEDVAFSNHPSDANSFVNAQLVVYPDGSIGDRYEKVHIVPFGEYVPLRGLLTALGVDLSLIGKDATRGQDPAQLHVNLSRSTDAPDSAAETTGDRVTGDDEVTVGVMISWEVFFGNRGRAAAQNGADFLLNPTNGSSYTWTILQTQQIASSRLRAAENGRWVVQDSPTGFSAFISPDGEVFERTGISEQAVIRRSVPLRTGTTIYTAYGDGPWIAALVAGLVGLIALAWQRRRPRSVRSPDRR